MSSGFRRRKLLRSSPRIASLFPPLLLGSCSFQIEEDYDRSKMAFSGGWRRRRPASACSFSRSASGSGTGQRLTCLSGSRPRTRRRGAPTALNSGSSTPKPPRDGNGRLPSDLRPFVAVVFVRPTAICQPTDNDPIVTCRHRSPTKSRSEIRQRFGRNPAAILSTPISLRFTGSWTMIQPPITTNSNVNQRQRRCCSNNHAQAPKLDRHSNKTLLT